MLWSALDPPYQNQGPPEGSPETTQGPPILLFYNEGGAEGTHSLLPGNSGPHGEHAGVFIRKQ